MYTLWTTLVTSPGPNLSFNQTRMASHCVAPKPMRFWFIEVSYLNGQNIGGHICESTVLRGMCALTGVNQHTQGVLEWLYLGQWTGCII